MQTVLISGAGIAGPALAYWLHGHGFTPTVVERAPGVRGGGQAVDIRGVALDVVRRMGLLDEVRELRTRMRGVSFVDADGTEIMSTTAETLTGGPVDGPDIEILRDDLAAVLHRHTAEHTEYLFSDTVTGLDQRVDGVHVTFERSAPRRFDLVVGADGLHSRVRDLAFGDESRFIRHLGVYLAVFTLDNHLGLDHWQTFHRTDGAMAGVYSARANTEARGMLGFESPPLEFDHRDPHTQRRIVAERFAGVGWETPALLKAMWTAQDFHFDSMSQIVMDRWSTGRVALLGDAGFCASPLAGQGTSTALVGAYVLAGELAQGDYWTAFTAYEAKMRPYVQACQRLATDYAGEPAPHEALQAAANAFTLPDYDPARAETPAR